jgi:glutathione-regulated potassium-efflux system ancillary protein KefG
MNRILVLFAHPALQKSRVNRELIRGIDRIPGVTFRDLYEFYPDLDINVRTEQKLLLEHDILVFQHPFYWYSTPAILKEWQDLVLEHGWAYGQDGNALRGKKMLSVISTGGREEAYQKNGYNRYTIRELLSPIDQTAYLCGMEYLPPFVVHGTHRISADELHQQRNDYHRLLSALVEDKIDLKKALQFDRLNQDPDAILLKQAEK